ncbi:MAG: hypothetical protein COT73_06425 [Bdellovibrio sp. CG10_big_fil_rev_8_21_14_0_10_47_8]|nr:MAG: hypothetical protein COT73_06425 [Bdellovibrio sp. CG10_big_fil_rev_8_21_14_0_10_47_8]
MSVTQKMATPGLRLILTTLLLIMPQLIFAASTTTTLRSPLDQAISAFSNNHQKTLEALLQKDPTLLRQRNETGINLLFAAVEERKVSDLQLMLKYQPDLEIKTDDGYTLIQSAAYDSTPLIVEILSKAGANVQVQDMDGNSLLHRAVMAGYKKMILTLLKVGVNTDMKNKEGKTAFDLALKNPRLNQLQKKLKPKKP